MKKTQIVLLMGTAGSGKDSVGQCFVDNGYTKTAFADAPKEEYAKKHNIDVKVLLEQGEEKEKHRPRLIELAESERKKDPFVWINKALAPYVDENGFYKQGVKLVVTDCRRESEIDWLFEQKKMIYELNNLKRDIKHYVDIKLILIIKPDVNDKDSLTHFAIGLAMGLTKAGLNFNMIDAVIHNDGTLEQLKTKTLNCIEILNLW